MKQESQAGVDRFNEHLEGVLATENHRLKVSEVAKKDVVRNAGQDLAYFQRNAANKELKEK